MGRSEHFKAGTQPDMFAEHFGAATGLSDPEMTTDKQGRIMYLGRDTTWSKSTDYRAHGDYDPTALYPSSGYLRTSESGGGGLAPAGSHEIDAVHVDSARRRSGVASSLLQYARQFGGDIRHSMIRSSDGARWSRAVGGPDAEGRDASSYDYVQTHLLPRLARQAVNRDSRLNPAEQRAKASVPHPLGIDRMY